MIDQKKLALIHIIQRRLQLTDAAYRDILRRAAGVASARELDEAGFRRLMRAFVRSEHYVLGPGGLTFRQKMFVEHLQERLGWDAGHFHNFLKKYYHRDRVEELDRAGAAHLIESLKGALAHGRRLPGGG